MGVSESPAIVSMLGQPSKVSGFLDAMPSLIYLALAPRRCDDREFSSERINAQIVANVDESCHGATIPLSVGAPGGCEWVM